MNVLICFLLWEKTCPVTIAGDLQVEAGKQDDVTLMESVRMMKTVGFGNEILMAWQHLTYDASVH